ncbi:hypothetical protein ALC56_02303 [Trachymyrmex septentrionalis]|uniref:Uncharacterized protein n=1 Tax=Trachymyrmex septentrionalis TaxID=34720 RepID=A0A151K0B7_9HYME|nr:hypothetical protein ALC56_02303 [Trachymyrmex septentrionalis]
MYKNGSRSNPVRPARQRKRRFCENQYTAQLNIDTSTSIKKLLNSKDTEVSLSRRIYYNCFENLYTAVQIVYVLSTKTALDEEKQLTETANKNPQCLSVSNDGTWKKILNLKRSALPVRVPLFGVTILIGKYSKKAIDTVEFSKGLGSNGRGKLTAKVINDLTSQDEHCLKRSEHHASISLKEARIANCKDRAVQNDFYEVEKDILYGPGIDN